MPVMVGNRNEPNFTQRFQKAEIQVLWYASFYTPFKVEFHAGHAKETDHVWELAASTIQKIKCSIKDFVSKNTLFYTMFAKIHYFRVI